MGIAERVLGLPSECEFDQTMSRAIHLAASEQLRDTHILIALIRLNAFSVSALGFSDEHLLETLSRIPSAEKYDYKRADRVSPHDGLELHPDLRRIATRLKTRITPSTNTVTTAQFMRAWIDDAVATGDDYMLRSFGVDLLTRLAGGMHDAPLSELPRLADGLRRLNALTTHAEDFQYALAIENGRIVFGATTVLRDVAQRTANGLIVPQRALLTHFKETFTAFTTSEIGELEDLLNARTSSEADLQQFFERHPHFLRKWDYREVFAHVALARPEGVLIPDFILTDRELQRAAILELKLPKPMLVRRQTNRERFSSGVMEARAQLLRYRDWFRDRSNRMSLVERVGMEIYEPQMIVVIGRSKDFANEFERQSLRASLGDIEVVTYDEILTACRRRQLIIRGME